VTALRNYDSDEWPQERRPIVPFCPVRCPDCGSKKPITRGQRGRERYHRCRECGVLFKSYEIEPKEFDQWKTTE